MLLAAVLLSGPPAASLAGPKPRKQKRVRSHVSLHVSKHHVMRGERLIVRGRVRPDGSRRVKVVVGGADPAIVRLNTNRGGRFRLPWRARRTGGHRVRAHVIHDRRIRGSSSPSRRVTAYRHAHASYYGPGLYGNGMACGGTLLPGTLGVAHKTLPCGSRVRFRYGGRTVTVRVVDRGPYVAGRDFDLTAATRVRLGFPGNGVLLASR
jgi:hypothetical protein